MRRTQEDIDRSINATEAVIKVHRAWDESPLTDEAGSAERALIDLLTEDEARAVLDQNWYSHSVPWVAALLRLAGPDASQERILELSMEMDIAIWERKNKRQTQ